ncbi:MAG: threonine-phosphate decarboxylase CobD [Snowella sp.]|nr:threonine-phosphate decarboxylase CobD [Snowella sp.]
MSRPSHGGNLAWAATIAGCPASSLLDFSASINPLGPPTTVITAIEAAFSQLNHYPDPNYFSLRSHLSTHHSIPIDYILPGNGSAELLTWVGRELAQQDETVLLTPAFGDYQRALTAFNAQIKTIPFDVLTQISLNEIIPTDADFSRSGLLLNNPHNPTGRLFSRAEILPLLDRFGLVVIDEAFMDFLPPDRSESLIAEVERYPNLIILRSLTKFYSLPGLRLGYAIAHPDFLQRWQAWRDPWPVNVLAEAAAIAGLQDQDFQQQTWDWLARVKPQLKETLNQIPGLFTLESAANYFLVQTEMSSSQLQRQLLIHHQLLIRDCLSFPELGDRFFRVAVRTESENLQLIHALQTTFNSLV